MSAIEQKVHLATAPLKVALDRLRRRGMVSQTERLEIKSHGAWFELTEDGRKTISRIYARHTEDIEAVMGVLSPRRAAVRSGRGSRRSAFKASAASMLAPRIDEAGWRPGSCGEPPST